MNAFILSQILVGIAICFDILSFQYKSRRHILICLMISCTLIGGHFALLGHQTAAMLAMLAVLRYLASLLTTSNRLMWLFILLPVVVAATTWSGLLSALSCLGSVFGAAGAFSVHDKQLRLFILVGTLLWLLHNILAGSPTAVLMEIIFLASNLVGYYRFYWRQTEAARYSCH